ncbi:MAG: GtrA family protein [Bacteroidota bacterium]|nr:GtrA family protein [Bacteroidota bacterium]
MVADSIKKKKTLYTFLKAQSVSMISSAIDFSFTIFFTEIIKIWYALSSVTGTCAGGITCFILSKHWVFRSKNKNKIAQIQRFVLIWLSSLLLNFSGLILLTEYLKTNYLISKIIIAVLVGILFNYNLQKIFVFKD